MKNALLPVVLLAMFAPGAFAHEVRPAYLELRQTGPETYDALWKVPGLGENLRLGLYVELPAGCTNASEPRASMVNNAYSERWTVKCAGGLTGGTIQIAGLTATTTDVLVRLERLDGTTQVGLRAAAALTLKARGAFTSPPERSPARCASRFRSRRRAGHMRPASSATSAHRHRSSAQAAWRCRR